MAEKQKNQIVVLEPVTKTVNELLEMITERDQAEIMPFMNPDEAVQCTRQFVPCMFVICIQTNNDIPNVLAVLKKLKPDIKQGVVKTLLVSKVKNPQLQKLIGEFGVTDYIEEPIPARSLQFKANLQLRAVDTTRKQLELKKKAEEKIVFKTSASNGDDAAQTLNGEIKPRNKPALQLANDTFLIKNGQVKKQAKKFLVELDGPDPSTGEWVTDGEDSATKNPNWRWQPHEQEDEPGSAEGDGWVATGDKPQFKPVNRKWQLASEKPGLFYKKKNSKIAEKVGVDEKGDVTVAEDSPMAEENLRKNLAKVERVRKRKAAEAARHAPAEKEQQEAEAKGPPAEEDETKAKGPEAILKALRKKKAAKPAAAIEADAEAEPAEKPEATATAEEEDSPARKKLEQLRRARKARGAKAGAPEEILAEEAAEEPRSAETEAEAATEESEDGPTRVQKRKQDKPEKPEAQVLDFLQKKKGGRKEPAAEEQEEPAAAEAAPAAAAEPEVESSTEKLLKKARERRNKAKAAGTAEEEIEAEAAEAAPEAAEEPEAEEAAEEPAAEAREEEDSSGTEELLKRARERKKKRDERKRELLEEIEAEEAEAEPEELEAIAREKKKRAPGEDPEEEEKTSTSERLEKLRRKRAELAALEESAEEEEEQGEHFHTAQAEELRGMNVWDTDEEAVAADEEAKRLKKLKKDRAEKEATEKADRGGEEFADDFAELDGEERKTKKKRRGTAGTQAEGLEDAFAQGGEEPEDFMAAEEAADDEAGAQESVSDRLARLRKARDEKKASRESAKEMPEAPEDAAAKQDQPDSGEDLRAGDTRAEEQANPAATAEAEDLLAGKKKSEGSEETEEASLAEPREEKEIQAAAAESFEPNKSEKKIVAESAGDLLAKKSKTSESMRKFLERRKQKKEAEQAEAVAAAAKPKMIQEEAGADEKRSFLAIFVAVSDSFGAASEKKMANVLRALEGSLDHCVAFFAEARGTDERFKVILGNSVEPGTELPAENSHVEDIASDAGEVMGHLVIRWSEPRTELAKDEAEAIQRAMLTLRPLASQWITATRGEKAA